MNRFAILPPKETIEQLFQSCCLQMMPDLDADAIPAEALSQLFLDGLRATGTIVIHRDELHGSEDRESELIAIFGAEQGDPIHEYSAANLRHAATRKRSIVQEPASISHSEL